ncbi:MAG: hypothetical protein DRH15_13900 [Deltaproteobacteria bacterium]|nr:MAG: hypothetical protein DRH15_13900 [Deltaproteobacteria bacterium]
MNPKKILAVAKKEFTDNVRNKWLLVLTAIFLVMTVASSIVAGGGEMGEMDLTVTTLLTLSSMLIPVIAIMLGYGTIAGEAESGALSVVLAYPVRRTEVLLGKFIGLSSVITASVVGGFGIAGIIISLATKGNEWRGYIIFMLLTILLGVLYISLSMCFSAILKRKSTALGGGILVFFWGMIIGTIWIGIYLSTGGSLTELYSGRGTFPNWFWVELFLSPQDGNQTAILLAFGKKEVMGFSFNIPSWVNLGSIVLSQIVWTILPLLLAIKFFKRRDI